MTDCDYGSNKGKKIENLDITGYATFGGSVIPFIIISFIVYRVFLLKNILFPQDYNNQLIYQKFNGPITKLKLVLKGVTFSSITTTIVVSSYTEYFAPGQDCPSSSQIISFYLKVTVWIIAISCYIYVWYWDTKKTYERLQKTSKLNSFCDRIKTIIIVQFLNLSIATAFIQDAYIGTDVELKQYCVCTTHGSIVWICQIVWLAQTVAMIFALFCNKGCKPCWYFIVFVCLCIQLTARLLLFWFTLTDLQAARYEYKFDWGDWLWFWLLFSMFITGFAMIYILIRNKKNDDEDNKKKHKKKKKKKKRSKSQGAPSSTNNTVQLSVQQSAPNYPQHPPQQIPQQMIAMHQLGNNGNNVYRPTSQSMPRYGQHL